MMMDLKAINKGGVSVDMASKYAHEAHKQGFTIHGCFMIGAPGETKETAQQTIDFAKSLPLDTVQITGVASYPGTSLYKWAKENNFLSEPMIGVNGSMPRKNSARC